jgi:hypothetical protein
MKALPIANCRLPIWKTSGFSERRGNWKEIGNRQSAIGNWK